MSISVAGSDASTVSRPVIPVQVLATLALVGAATLWGTSLAATKAAMVALPPTQLACLRFVGEGIWVVLMMLLEEDERRRIFAALQIIAALRAGPMTANERAFLGRIAEAFGEPIDMARIERLHAQMSERQQTQRHAAARPCRLAPRTV